MLDGGNKQVLVMLKESGALMHNSEINHRYPVDWRTKKPVLLRETMQWFADVSTLRQSAMLVLANVQV